MATLLFILNTAKNALISIMGLRTAILIIIINAICTFVMSVVSLVTIDAVENLSILRKE